MDEEKIVFDLQTDEFGQPIKKPIPFTTSTVEEKLWFVVQSNGDMQSTLMDETPQSVREIEFPASIEIHRNPKTMTLANSLVRFLSSGKYEARAFEYNYAKWTQTVFELVPSTTMRTPMRTPIAAGTIVSTITPIVPPPMDEKMNQLIQATIVAQEKKETLNMTLRSKKASSLPSSQPSPSPNNKRTFAEFRKDGRVNSWWVQEQKANGTYNKVMASKPNLKSNKRFKVSGKNWSRIMQSVEFILDKDEKGHPIHAVELKHATRPQIEFVVGHTGLIWENGKHILENDNITEFNYDKTEICIPSQIKIRNSNLNVERAEDIRRRIANGYPVRVFQCKCTKSEHLPDKLLFSFGHRSSSTRLIDMDAAPISITHPPLDSTAPSSSIESRMDDQMLRHWTAYKDEALKGFMSKYLQDVLHIDPVFLNMMLAK